MFVQKAPKVGTGAWREILAKEVWWELKPCFRKSFKAQVLVGPGAKGGCNRLEAIPGVILFEYDFRLGGWFLELGFPLG